MEVILSEELSKKHPVFPVSLVKPYHTRNALELNKKVIVKIPLLPEDKTNKLQVQKILKEKKARQNGKDIKLYLVRYKNQSADTDEWLPENNIPDASIHLRNFRHQKRNISQ